MSAPRSTERPPSPLAAAAAGGALAALWWAAYRWTAAPFFVVITVAGLAAGLVGAGLRRRLVDPPPLGIGGRTVALAVAVAAAHYAVGRGLLVGADRLLPWLVDDAAAAYGRVDGLPLAVQVVLAGGVIAPLEEVLWRGGVQPLVVRRLAPRPDVVRVGAAVAVYTAFHLVTLHPSLVAAAALGGIVWGWLAHRTGSVGAVMVAHGTWTALMVAAPPLR